MWLRPILQAVPISVTYAEGTYKAFWVDDINRNRIWDRNRERAQPFRFETFDVAHGDSVDLGTLYFSVPDTVAPED
jgi:hypothetical protein